MNPKLLIRNIGLAVALVLLGAAGQAQAAVALTVNLAGIESRDAQGSTDNVVLVLDAVPGATVDMISWDLTLSTVGASWLSEATLLIRNSAGDGVAFNPGFGDDASGSDSYFGTAGLVSLGTAFTVLADGKLYLEFYETYDDASLAADAIYGRGSITLAAIGVVPEPAAYSLLALGLLGLAATTRRRRFEAASASAPQHTVMKAARADR